MLLGGLLTKGLRAAVASKPYKKFRKEAMTKQLLCIKKHHKWILIENL